MLESMLTKDPKLDCGAISLVKRPAQLQITVAQIKRKG